jgi:hypothetical protein
MSKLKTGIIASAAATITILMAVGFASEAAAGARSGWGGGGAPIVRDHRAPAPIVRDHRTPAPTVRDHRAVVLPTGTVTSRRPVRYTGPVLRDAQGRRIPGRSRGRSPGQMECYRLPSGGQTCKRIN